MPGVTTPFNTGSSLTIQQVIYDTSKVNLLGVSGFTVIENQVLLNMARGVSAESIVSSFTATATDCNKLTSFNGDIMINNTSIDTPNLAMISKYVATSLDLSLVNLTMGTNSYNGSSRSYSGFIEDVSGTVAYVSETLAYDFSDNENPSLDATNEWSISFTDNSNNARMTRAANSYLNARDQSGNLWYPLQVTELSFNHNYALANNNTGSAFNNQFTVNDAIGVPTRIDLCNNNLDSCGNTFLSLTYNGNGYSSSNSEYGSFKFTINQNDPETNSYSDLGSVNASDLPFGYSQNGGAVQSMPSDIASNFNSWFNSPPSNTTFDFSINAVNSGAGYYNVAYPYSKTFNDANSSPVFTIDDTALLNSTTYIQQGYADNSMDVTVTNGYLTLSSGTNSSHLTLGGQAERLDLSYTSVSGEVALLIQDPNHRTSATSTDFSGTLVIYPTDNSSGILTAYGVTNTPNVIDASYMTTDKITVSTQQILNGYSATDVNGGYSYNGNANTYISDASSKSVLYSATTDPNLSYSVTGSFTSSTDVAELILVNSVQNLINPSGSILWNFVTDQSGTPGNVPYMGPSGPQYVSSSNQKPYIQPTLSIHNMLLSDFSYVEYRGLFEPKRFSDICGNGILDVSSTIDISGVTQPAGCTFVFGAVDTSSGIYTFTPSAPQYALTSASNLKDAIATAAQNQQTGITKQNLKYATYGSVNYDPNYVYHIDFSYGSIGNSTFSDTVSYYFNSDFIDPCNNTFYLYNPSGVNTSIFNTIANQTQDGTFFVQVPIGHYTNLYMQTPPLDVITVSGVEQLQTPLYGRISFTVAALESLWFSLQGSTDPSASYTDIDVSGNWKTISKDLNGNPRVGVEAYENQPSYFNVPDLSGNGQGIVSLATINNNQQVKYILTNPGYGLRVINDTNDICYNVIGARFPTVADIANSTPSSTTAGLYQVGQPGYTYFNPANFPVPSYTAIQGGVNIHPSLDISYAGGVTTFVVDDHSGHIFTISTPNVLNRDLTIWRCPQDVYDVSENGTIGTIVQSGDATNNSVQLVNGVYLYGTKNLVPSTAPSRYTFNICGDYIAVNMVNGFYLTGNNYESATQTPSEITGTNGGKTTEYNDITRELSFDYYRGYQTSTNLSGETQIYTINRYQTLMQLSNSSSLPGVTDAATNSFIIYNGLQGYDPSFVMVDASGSAFDVNLLFDFSQSMLPSATTDAPSAIYYTIGVSGDTVEVYKNNSLQSTTSLTAASVYNLSGGVSIVPERIKVQSSFYGSENVEYEVYGVHRDSADVTIEYDASYGGNASGHTYGTTLDTVSVSTLETSGYDLNRNLHISSASGKNYYPAPNPTYLVAPPPYAKFQGLGYNAAGKFPFNYGPSGPLVSNVSGGYDSTHLYTQYTPITNDGGSINLAFTQSADLQSTITSPNNTYNVLSYYVTGTTSDTSYPILVRGNHLRLVENANGEPKTLFDGFMDLSLVGFPTYSDSSLTTTTTGSAIFNPASVNYDLSYSQDLRSVGIYGPGPTIYLEISGAFNIGSGSFQIDPTNASQPYLYGVAPYTDPSGAYALSFYRYSQLSAANNLEIYNWARYDVSSAFHVLPYYAHAREYKHVSLPTIPFGATPYNLQTALNSIQLTDISNDWVSDASFNGEQLNFEIVALDYSGQYLLQGLVATQLTPIALPNVSPDFSYNSVNVNVVYFTLPDILNARSADGAPVMRILYNGTLVAPALSAAQISLMPLPTNNAATTIPPNQEYVNFNVGTNTSTYDNSGAMQAP